MKNAKDRRENNGLENDWFEGEMLYFMLRQLRSQRRRRVRETSILKKFFLLLLQKRK